MNKIQILRKENNLIQQDLAEKLGVSNKSISKYERGEREPDFNTLKKLSNIFNVSIDYILGVTDSPRDSGKTADEVSDAIYSVLLEKGVIAPGEQLSKEKIEYVKKLLNKAIELSQL